MTVDGSNPVKAIKVEQYQDIDTTMKVLNHDKYVYNKTLSY